MDTRIQRPLMGVRDGIGRAAQLAARALDGAWLGGVLVDLRHDDGGTEIVRLTYLLHAWQRPPDGDQRLRSIWVDVDTRTREAALSSSGEYSADQLAQLAALPGSGFPPEPLDLDRVAHDVADVVARVLGGSGTPAATADRGTAAQLALSLVMREGRPVWTVHHAVAGAFIRTLFLDASQGTVVHDQLQRERGAPASPMPQH